MDQQIGNAVRIGVVSDTHGRLAPGAVAALAGVDEIWHAGDVGGPNILAELAAIAPVTAVQGNVDTGKPWARQLPEVQRRQVAGLCFYMTHIGGRPKALLQHLPVPRPDVYIFGHSHQAVVVEQDGVLFLNPGAAGRPRFGGSISLAIITIRAGTAEADIIPL